jgi:hypothetical protein
MAFNYSPMGVPFKLTPEDMGAVDYGTAFKKGLEAYYLPQQMQAQIQELQARAQKNKMLGDLFSSLMNGQEGSSSSGFSGNNLKAAVLKATTGIDPYLRSPEETQDLKIRGSTKQAAKKANLTTGSSDIAREYLQNKVSMPKEYMGAFGSIKQAKDRVLASSGDKAAQERLIQAAVAERLVPEWPHAGHFISNNLPPELQKEVERRHNEAVREVNRAREQFLNSGGEQRRGMTSDREMDININEQAHRLGVSPRHIMEDADYFKTSPEVVISALQAGVKTEKEMRDWIKGLK